MLIAFPFLNYKFGLEHNVLLILNLNHKSQNVTITEKRSSKKQYLSLTIKSDKFSIPMILEFKVQLFVKHF